MKEKLSILIVNYNTSDFIGIGLYALSKLTKNSYKVFIIDNNSESDDYGKLKGIASTYDDVFIERFETDLKGSMAHGTALNALVEKVDTPFFSILDSDAVWLKKNWDEILINELSDKAPVIGTQAPLGKPQDFPLMFAILFRTKEFRELDIDFRPKDIEAKQDTGFEIREKYMGTGCNGKNIKYLNTREYKKGPFANVICGEYYLDGHKEVFASHFSRGSSLGANKYNGGLEKIVYNIPVIGASLRKRKGEKEKKRWIRICKKIIDKQ